MHGEFLFTAQVAEEIEAFFDPADEGLVRVVNFRLWLRVLKKSFEGLGQS